MSSDYVLVLTTLPADADAQAFARTLVGERLAACVNLLPPMESVYRWQGLVQSEQERQIVVKTTQGRVAELSARIRQLHPYEVPELIVLPILSGDDAYLGWLSESTQARADPA